MWRAWQLVPVRIRAYPQLLIKKQLMEKVSNKEKMKTMKKGATIKLPISSLETIRNNVSLLNAKHYNEGKKWKSESFKEKGIVIVTRTA